MDYPKLISEKWNLTAKFNCLQAIYFYAPSALAVPMCDKNEEKIDNDHILRNYYRIKTTQPISIILV